MAVSNPVLNSSLDSSSSSSFSMKQGDKESPKNHSSSFSISAILSDDIGSQRKSFSWSLSTPTSERDFPKPSSERVHTQTPKRPKELDFPRNSALRRQQISLTEAASMMSPSTTTTVQVHPSHPVASMGGVTPPLHPARHNSSITASPFDPSFLHALGQQPSPTEKEDLLSDSLGMLSTVAMYHSELSSTVDTPVENKLADIRITSSCDGSDKSSDWNGADPVISVPQRPPNKSRTPSILKRRSRKTSVTLSSDSCVSGDESNTRDQSNSTYLNVGFLSPLANEKSALINQQSGFSPSIFLSRPGQSTVSDTLPHCEAERAVIGQSPASDSDSLPNQHGGVNFTTSTPIKSDKENAVQRDNNRRKTGWSPTILRGGRRHLLKETNESSSGSDSEQPVKRPRSSSLTPPKKKRRKSKARTKLSPLLENACSPIPRADHAPSPLTQAHSTTPTRPQAAPQAHPHSSTSVEHLGHLQMSSHAYPPHSINTPHPIVSTNQHTFSTLDQSSFLSPSSLRMQGLALAHTQPVIPQLFQHTAQNLAYPVNHVFPTTPPVIGPSQLHKQYTGPVLSPTHQYPKSLLSPPLGHTTQGPPPYVPMPFCMPHATSYTGGSFVPVQMVPNLYSLGNTSNFVAPGNSFPASLPGNSVYVNQSMSNASFVKRDEKIKSVPPRFIFSHMRPEGKRSRLTEAINKSLSETPAQSTKLPVEWTKYACGQTNDQRDLTEKARSFILQCRPRTLTFEEDSS